jgi:branched-chain amino acid transport system ATP-binding protein
MKGITATLLDEHELIARAAASLERLADEALASDDLCIVTAIDLLEFFQDFVEGAHQAKEEEHLFPALLASGLARHRVLDLRKEHEREREAFCSMWVNLEAAAYGDRDSHDEFVREASEYAALQREHADDEDRMLLPLVEELLDDDLQRRVLAGFRDVDARRLHRRYEDYAKLVDDVEARQTSPVWNWDRGPAFLELVAP